MEVVLAFGIALGVIGVYLTAAGTAIYFATKKGDKAEEDIPDKPDFPEVPEFTHPAQTGDYQGDVPEPAFDENDL